MPDWEAIEKEYRMGQKSIRTIASEFGCAHTTIIRRAKRDGWIQDKSAEVARQTRAALVTHHEGRTTKDAPRTSVTRQDIDKAVQTNIEVIRNHRSRISQCISTAELLHGQLRDAANNRDTIEGLIVQDTEKPDLKRRNAMMKAVSLPSHAGVLRDLSLCLKNLIPLERQAFNIDDDGTKNEPEWLAALLSALPEEFAAQVAIRIKKQVEA